MKTLTDKYPDVLKKTSETEVSIFGIGMTSDMFCQKMVKMGFDGDITRTAVRTLKVGGTWCLSFTPNQRLVLRSKPKPSGF